MPFERPHRINKIVEMDLEDPLIPEKPVLPFGSWSPRFSVIQTTQLLPQVVPTHRHARIEEIGIGINLGRAIPLLTFKLRRDDSIQISDVPTAADDSTNGGEEEKEKSNP
jgi:hypothetical protein